METMKLLLAESIEALYQVIEYAEKNNLTNTQEFINFLDKINELSVTY